jgi:RNA polymerase sigma-70 factor (ECF subfamily)
VEEAPEYTRSEPRMKLPHGDNGHEELNNVFSRCQSSLFKTAYRFLENAADAEDAVQDALLSAYKHIDQFRGEAQMSTWLAAIVSNSARMKLRRRPRQVHVSVDELLGDEPEHSISIELADSRPSPEDECQTYELQALLKELVTQLSPSLRQTFQLRELDGFTTSEAAHILGVALGTVKAQLAWARAKLRQSLRWTLDSQRRARRTCATPRMSEK